MKIQAVIPAGGIGERLQSGVIKPLVILKGKPLIVHTLEVFDACSLIDGLVVAVPEHHIQAFENIVGRYRFRKVKRIVPGGATRCASVYNGLKALDHDVDMVVIHDAARPLLTERLLTKAIEAARHQEALIVAVPMKSTVKRVNPGNLFVEGTLDRRLLWEVQTPQIFKKNVIWEAHQKIKDLKATDDAFLVEQRGHAIKICQGEYANIKITTPEDLAMAEAILSNRGEIDAKNRVGL